MFYVLTADEYDGMEPSAELDKRNEALEAVRRITLKLSGFHCIHEKPRINDYCDRCPVSALRVHTEEHETYEVAHLICQLDQEYSQ